MKKKTIKSGSKTVGKFWEKLGAEIRRIREEKDYGLNEFATSAGVDPGSMSRIETGQQRASVDLLIQITDALDVPLGNVFAVAGGAMLPLHSESPLLPLIKASEVRAFVEELNKKGSAIMETAQLFGVPLVPGSDAVGGRGFIFEIRGPSARAMTPDYQSGDQAVMAMDVDPEPGDHVIAIIDGEADAVFRIYKPQADGSIHLDAINSDWPPIIIDRKMKTGSIVAVMVERRHKRRRRD